MKRMMGFNSIPIGTWMRMIYIITLQLNFLLISTLLFTKPL